MVLLDLHRMHLQFVLLDLKNLLTHLQLHVNTIKDVGYFFILMVLHFLCMRLLKHIQSLQCFFVFRTSYLNV